MRTLVFLRVPYTYMCTELISPNNKITQHLKNKHASWRPNIKQQQAQKLYSPFNERIKVENIILRYIYATYLIIQKCHVEENNLNCNFIQKKKIFHEKNFLKFFFLTLFFVCFE